MKAIDLKEEDIQLLNEVSGNPIHVSLLGETLKQQFDESLYCNLIKYSQSIFRNTGKSGGNCIITSPEVAGLIELCMREYHAIDYVDELSTVKYQATINNRWKLYTTALLDVNAMFIATEGEGKNIIVDHNNLVKIILQSSILTDMKG